VLTIEDRLALRALVDAYAEAVDRKDGPAVAALFMPQGRMVVPDPTSSGTLLPTRTGRDEVLEAMGNLARYRTLTHLVGGQVLRDGDPVTGVTTCVAHHLYERDGAARLLVMGIHYHDTYDRDGGEWRFAERRFEWDWRDDRAVGTGGRA